MAAYITPYEIKLELPDVLDPGVLRYDTQLRSNAEQASRYIERLTGRYFFATPLTLYMERLVASDELWLPETLLEISKVEMSSDCGATYELLASTDYLKYGGKQLYLNQTPYHMLKMARAGNYTYWWMGEKAVKITCIAGYHDDYAHAWQLSTQAVQDNPLSASATAITVTNADIEDYYLQPELQVGHILRIGEEQVEIMGIDPTNNKLQVIRATNNTVAAEHAQGTAMYIYRPMPILKRAIAIQAIRWFKRGQQSFVDVSASRDAVQNTYNRMLDMDIVGILASGGLNRIDLT